MLPTILPSLSPDTASRTLLQPTTTTTTITTSSPTTRPTTYPYLTPSNFNFITQIGSGGFGTVYLAQRVDNEKGEIIAMKTISKREVVSSTSERLSRRNIQQLLDERNILTAVDHPFIVNLLYFFQDQDRLFFGMELAESGDFHSVIPGNGLNLYTTRFYAAELASALAYIHSINVIYRDLKPENILLRGNGHIMLTDFGLSKHADGGDRADTSTETVGTPAYFAPELVMKQPYGKAVDWWAFGCVIHEMLTGLQPFQGSSLKETMKNIVSKQPKITASVAKDNGNKEASAVQAFLEKLLAKNPLHRINSSRVKQHAFFKAKIEEDGNDEWSWGDLESRKIDPPLQRENLLHTPAMQALLNARKDMNKRTNLEDIFAAFDDFDKNCGKRPTVPIFKALAFPSPATGGRSLSDSSSPPPADARTVRTRSQESATAGDDNTENIGGMEHLLDPVLRTATYDFEPGNMQLLQDSGTTQKFNDLFHALARGCLHFDTVADFDQNTMKITMVFQNHHFLNYYTKYVKDQMVEAIRPYLVGKWREDLSLRPDEGDDIKKLGKCRSEKVVRRSMDPEDFQNMGIMAGVAVDELEVGADVVSRSVVVTRKSIDARNIEELKLQLRDPGMEAGEKEDGGE
jgi:serine/threonine protein kinase